MSEDSLWADINRLERRVAELEKDNAEKQRRIDAALGVIDLLREDVERYVPYVEAVAKQRYPFRPEDEVEAMEMMRERQQRLAFTPMTPEQEAAEAALRG